MKVAQLLDCSVSYIYEFCIKLNISKTIMPDVQSNLISIH